MHKREAGPDAGELKRRRVALNMSQRELARRFGVAVTTVARWEMLTQHGRPAPAIVDLALRHLEAAAGCNETAS